jgi:hypothetical protein
VNWTFGCVVTIRADAEVDFDAAHTAFSNEQTALGHPLSTEADDQINAAKDAALYLVNVHNPDAPELNVVFSGRANPGHAEEEGSPSEAVQVNVTAVY